MYYNRLKFHTTENMKVHAIRTLAIHEYRPNTVKL